MLSKEFSKKSTKDTLAMSIIVPTTSISNANIKKEREREGRHCSKIQAKDSHYTSGCNFQEIHKQLIVALKLEAALFRSSSVC